MITVAIPVGPRREDMRYLSECLESVHRQTKPPEEILLVDDMAGLHPEDFPDCRITRLPWRMGVPGAFNAGVACAKTDAVFMLGADDLLEPTCLAACWAAFEANKRQDAYYYIGITYSDDREDKTQTVPCNAAMVTKGLWRKTGGFAPEASAGANDAALISVLMVHMPEALVAVKNGEPLMTYRVHNQSLTGRRGQDWQGIILATRDRLTKEWQAPEWGRTAP